MNLSHPKQASLSVEIIGAGVVGRAVGHAFIEHSIVTQFIDTNQHLVDTLRTDQMNAKLPEIIPLSSSASFICVPTPSTDQGIDLQFIKAATILLGKRLALTDQYHVVVVKSTVIPGTTENVIIPLLEEHSGKKVGQAFGVSFNPEYLRENKASVDAVLPRLILIGQHDSKAGDLVEQLYASFRCPKVRISLKAAEFQKYVHNLFNATKIAFFNEMREVAEQWKITQIKDILALTVESCEGIWNPAYGTNDMGAFGGSCLPKDVTAFIAAAQAENLEVPVVAAVKKQNQNYHLKHPKNY